MAAIFISHSSRDDAIAAEVRTWLTSQGHRSLFLDFDPELGIPAGRSWEQELYRQLSACRVAIVLCSEASMSSRWCFAEITQARALGKVLLPVRIDDCTIDGLLTSRQVIDLTKGRDEGFERLRRGLLGAGVDPTDVFDWDGARPPYPGLLAFQSADAAIYFGRAQEIGTALDVLNRVRRLGAPHVVVVVGASGSGKSSLVRAGLVPRLRRDTERWLVLDPFRPRDDPVAELGAVFDHAFASAGETRDLGEIARRLGAADDQHDAATLLRRMAAELRRACRRPEATALLIVDQLEELLVADSSEAFRVLRCLRNAADSSDAGLIVLATLRSDFLSAFQQHPALADIDCELMPVGPMSIDDATQVIEGPARVAGLGLEPGLVQAMLADTDTDDALPLLAFTLRELYDHFGDDGVLKVDEYRELGGLHGALARAADELTASQRLTPQQEELLRRAFLGMVRLTDDDRWVRRVVRWNDVPPEIHGVLERFVAARLLVSAGDSATRTIEVAHEALFRSWDRLAEWLQQDAEALRLLRDVDNAAASWDATGRQALDLWRGGRLDRVTELTRSGDLQPTATSQAFIDESLATRQAELDAQERSRRRRLRIAAAVTVGALGLAAVATIFFLQANRESDRAAQEARRNAALALAAQANDVPPSNPALALALAAEATRTVDPPLAQAEAALVDARVAFAYHLGQPVGQPITGHDAVNAVAFSPDGKLLASAGRDGTVRLWNPATGEQVGEPLRGHNGAVYAVAFSPDGSRLASAGSDAYVRLWDPASGELRDTLLGHTGEVQGLAFNPDGTRLASGSGLGDGSVRLWDPANGERAGELLLDSSDWVSAVAFNGDGSRLVTVGSDQMVHFWDPVTAQELGEPLEAHTSVRAAAFNPDGSVLVTAGDDGTIRLWNPNTGQETGQPLQGHTSSVRAVAFSPDGALIASAGEDGTVRLWFAEDGRSASVPLEGHTGFVYGVAFSPDGSLLASSSADGTVRLWEPRTRQPPSRVLEGHTDEVFGVAISPDGTIAASASADATVRLWDPNTGEPIGTPLQGHTDRVIGVAFSPDGTLLASASEDMTVRLWDPSTGEAVGRPLEGHTEPVLGVAFSPDGDLLASAGDDSVRVWDPYKGEPVGQPIEGHDDSWGVAFSPDGEVLAFASDATIRLWDPHEGRPIGEPLEGHTGMVYAVAFSPAGNLLASASADGTVRLWDTATGRPVGSPLRGHTGEVRGVAFSSDGTVLASAGADRYVRLWDAATGDPVGEPLWGHGGEIWSVAVGGEQDLVGTASSDATARLWDVLDIDRACALVEAYVTAADLREYLPTDTDPEGCELADTSAD